MTKSEAIKQLINDGISQEEAMREFKERCEYYMRGHDDTPLSYAEKLVIADIEEEAEMGRDTMEQFDTYEELREALEVDVMARSTLIKIERRGEQRTLVLTVNCLIDAGTIEDIDSLSSFVGANLEDVWGWEWLKELEINY